MEGFTPSVLVMIILAVIVGFAAGYFFMKQREKIQEAKKKEAFTELNDKIMIS